MLLSLSKRLEKKSTPIIYIGRAFFFDDADITFSVRSSHMAHEILKLTSVHPTDGYSHVAKAGNTLYIAGQVAKDPQGNLVGKGDIETQVRQVFTNLKNVLEESGGSLNHIVKLTTFLTHFNYRETYRNVRKEFLQAPFPANTMLIVESLASPDYMIEIEAIAVLD